MDVLSASFFDDKIAWYENTSGDGSSWMLHTITTDADSARSVYAADVDGDGDMDALSTSTSEDKVAWYENTSGDGSSWTPHTITTDADSPYSVHAADVDGDGDIDALSASTNDDKIAWYENTSGDGSSWTPHTITTDADDTRSVYAADMDGDDDIDVLSASKGDNKIAWYENTSGDGSSWTPHTITTDANSARSVYAADMDGDGDIDALSASANDDKIAWYENTSGDDLSVDNSSWTPHTITTNANSAQSVHAADMDGDGDIDALSASADDDKVVWYENIFGNGSFWRPHTITTNADSAQSVHAADVDGDGDMDALSASTNDDKITWYENTSGDGSSWTPHDITTNAIGAYSVYAADMDGDGDIDALSASVHDDKIAWYENTSGDGSSWTPHTITTNADGAWSVYAADMDGDGDIDALSASQLDDKIAWYENTSGDGSSWTPHTIATNADLAVSVYAADVDGDGNIDALSASFFDHKIAWYENTSGDGSSWTPHTITTDAKGALFVYAGDVDGDGDIDVFSASFIDHKVAWYENTSGDGSSWTPHTITTDAKGARSAHAKDLDGDGDIDVFSASQSDDKIAWYENTSVDLGIGLVSDLSSPQPVGTTIRWQAIPLGISTVDYRLSISPAGEPLRVMYDFDFRTFMKWTPIDDGEYRIELAAKRRGESEITRLETTFVVESRVDAAPIVTPTDNPLVALYSAPPCESGEMRVVFIRWGNKRPYLTNSKPCEAGRSMNFYIAGMRAESVYVMVHQVFDEEELLDQGPPVVHETGELPLNIPVFAVTDPADLQTSLDQPVTLYSPGRSVGDLVDRYTVATDFSGEVIWYYEPPVSRIWASYVTRPLPGGTMLTIDPTFSVIAQALREIDLAGNTVRATSARRINQQLEALGQDKINGIHHEATRFPNGLTLIIGAVEKMVVDKQGPGPVNVLGDMIVALDENFQVVWAWNIFDHLDVTRKATLDENCTKFCNTPIFLDDNVNDWTHSNTIAYSPADGNLLLSVRNQDWVVKIDYQNGIGSGDVIWKLGPDGDFTIESEDPYPWFTHQHDTQYIGDNQIILYDNGQVRCGPDPDPEDGCHSRGQVLNIDEDNMLVTLAHNTDLENFSKGYGSAQKLLNGNYSFTSGQNTPFNFATTDEFLPDGTKVFSVITADPLIYRSFRMESMYAP